MLLKQIADENCDHNYYLFSQEWPDLRYCREKLWLHLTKSASWEVRGPRLDSCSCILRAISCKITKCMDTTYTTDVLNHFSPTYFTLDLSQWEQRWWKLFQSDTIYHTIIYSIKFFLSSLPIFLAMPVCSVLSCLVFMNMHQNGIIQVFQFYPKEPKTTDLP